MNDIDIKIPIDPAMLKEEHEAKDFLGYLERATESGLAIEFIVYFLREFKKSSNVNDACWHAACEWDI